MMMAKLGMENAGNLNELVYSFNTKPLGGK